MATSGINFLNESIENSTSATISGFLNAIKNGCANNPVSLVLTGGYDHGNEKLEVHLVADITALRNM